MRIYLAGRMRGLPQNGKEIFAHYAAFLRSQGHFVVSPAELDESAGIDLAKEATLDEVSDAFARDVPAILSCDAIAMIPGWEQSTLAPIEKKIAEAFGKQVLGAETGHGLVLEEDFLCLGKGSFDEALDRYADSMVDSIKKGNTYVGVNRDHIEWPTVPVSEEAAPPQELPITSDAKPKPHRGFPSSGCNRKDYPMYDGLLRYFPNALAEVAHCSKVGNDQHNPGEPLHWAKDKSKDHGNCIVRHLIQAGTIDDDGVAHSAKLAWRALAHLECEIEQRA